MDSFTLVQRLTFQFNTGWSHLDKYNDIGTATIVRRDERVWDDNGEAGSQIVVLRVEIDNPPVKFEDIKEAIEDTMSFSCRCEHDCCGHVSGGVSEVLALDNGDYEVRLSLSRNV